MLFVCLPQLTQRQFHITGWQVTASHKMACDLMATYERERFVPKKGIKSSVFLELVQVCYYRHERRDVTLLHFPKGPSQSKAAAPQAFFMTENRGIQLCIKKDSLSKTKKIALTNKSQLQIANCSQISCTRHSI